MFEKAKKIIEQHEGRKRKPYLCTAKKLTIGVGRNLDDKGLTDDEIDYLFNNDVKECVKQLRYNFGWFDNLDEVRQIALTDMTFNLGIAGLKKFKKMLTALGSGDYDRAAIEAKDSAWFYQVGKRSERITEMIKTGVM